MKISGWDYGLHVDLSHCNPLVIRNMEWSAEGYQLWIVNDSPICNNAGKMSNTNILQMDFVKSALTVNPCMVSLFIVKLSLSIVNCFIMY